MARVSVEQQALIDARFDLLGRFLESDRHAALGRMILVWNECQERAAYILPERIVGALLGDRAGAEWLVEADLAEWADESHGAVRIKGTEGRIEWLHERRSASERGGAATRAKWQAKGGPNGLPYTRPNAGPSTRPNHRPNEGPLTPALAPALETKKEHTEPPPSPSAPVTPADAGPSSPKAKASRPRREPVPDPPAEWAPSLRAAWSDWLAHRCEIGKPLRATGARQQFALIRQLGPSAESAIRQSIAAGWQGIFPLKSGRPSVGFTRTASAPVAAPPAWLDVVIPPGVDDALYRERGAVPCPACGGSGGVATWFRPATRTARVLLCDECAPGRANLGEIEP